MKAYYGKNATPENDFGYNWVPKLTGNHSFFEYLYDMADGKMEGMFMMGQNPRSAAPNSRFQRTSLSKLKWLVVRDMVEIEVGYILVRLARDRARRIENRRHRDGGFLFSSGRPRGKGRRVHQTQRMLQWRQKAVNPPGDCRIEGWFMHQLALRLIAKAKHPTIRSTNRCARSIGGIRKMNTGEPQMEAVLAEINGWSTDPRA